MTARFQSYDNPMASVIPEITWGILDWTKVGLVLCPYFSVYVHMLLEIEPRALSMLENRQEFLFEKPNSHWAACSPRLEMSYF